MQEKNAGNVQEGDGTLRENGAACAARNVTMVQGLHRVRASNME